MNDIIIIIANFIIGYLLGWVNCDLYKKNKLIEEKRNEIINKLKQQANEK